MRSTELKNETATNDRMIERGAPRMAAIATLLLLVSLSATFAGRATSHTEQQQGRGTSQPATVDWKAVERAMGRPGAMQPGDVYKFSMPRGDLKVVVKGVEVKPALALGSWAAFKMVGNQAMVMGDIVMTEDEVNPVISRMQQGDPDVLAYDQSFGRLYVSAESGVISVFDEHGRNLEKIGEEFFAKDAHTVAVDQRTHRVYLPLQDVGGKPVLRIALPSDKKLQ